MVYVIIIQGVKVLYTALIHIKHIHLYKMYASQQTLKHQLDVYITRFVVGTTLIL